MSLKSSWPFYLLCSLSLLWSGSAEANNCVPARQMIEIPAPYDQMMPAYTRIHPSGKYVIFTVEGKAHILAIENGKARVIKTPMRGEAFPMPPDWSVIASPLHVNFKKSGFKLDTASQLIKNEANGDYINPWDGTHYQADKKGNVLFSSAQSGRYNAQDGIIKMGDEVIGQQEMHYYTFDDLLGEGTNAKPQFIDTDLYAWYHSVAEGPGSTADRKSVITVSQTGEVKKFDTMLDSNGKVRSVVPSTVKKLCPEGIDYGVRPTDLTPEQRAELEKFSKKIGRDYHQVTSDIQNMMNGHDCQQAYHVGSQMYSVFDEMGNQVYAPISSPNAPPINIHSTNIPSSYDCRGFDMERSRKFYQRLENLNIRQGELSSEFNRVQGELGNLPTPNHFSMSMAQPIVSPSGTEFAAKISPFGNTSGHMTTHIMELNTDGKCKVKKDLGYATNKVSFSDPPAGKKGRVAFGGMDGVAKLYDRDLDKTINLTKPGDGFNGITSYPGFTRDGRLMYLLNGGDGKTRLTVIDPHQLEPALGPCVQQAGVESVEAPGTKVSN